MPKLSRSDWYDLARDTNWTFRYVTEDEVFPEQLSGSHRVSAEGWLKWDEPYKIGYREYVHNQVTKDTTTYSLKNAIGRSKFFDALDPGWKSVIVAHYGAITMPDYLASIGEARMGRFGRAAAWRNTATFGTLDEVRHGQIHRVCGTSRNIVKSCGSVWRDENARGIGQPNMRFIASKWIQQIEICAC